MNDFESLKKIATLSCLAIWASSAFGASAQDLVVENAWTRATVPGQHATGAFMSLTATKPLRLISAQSEVAKVTEIHEMQHVDGVMKMRQVETIALPAGQSVELKPGSFHIMLIDLKRSLQVGEQVPLVLKVSDETGVEQTLSIQSEVRPLTAAPVRKPHQQ